MSDEECSSETGEEEFEVEKIEDKKVENVLVIRYVTDF